MSKLQTTTRPDLAQRSSGGIDVTLVWSPGGAADETVICVCDRQEGAYFETPVEPHRALEAYYHPCFYRDFSTIDRKDSRLAADLDPTGGS
jgi:hypothetical protein